MTENMEDKGQVTEGDNNEDERSLTSDALGPTG